MSTPKVSVVIPVYNDAKFIGQAIESVLAQTWRDFELIVVDNVSTDGTREVVRSFHDARLRLVEATEHVGPGANFNRALEQAQGEYIKLLPSDDVLYPQCLARQLAVLEDPAHAQVVLVSSLRAIMNEDGKKLFTPSSKLQHEVTGKRAIRKALRAGANILGEPLAVLFRAALLKQVQGFDPSLTFMLDVDLWCRMLQAGNLYALPEELGAFRISRRSLSFGLLGRQSRQYFAYLWRVRKQPEFGLSFWDVLVGTCRCVVREVLRTGAYWYYLRR